MSCNELVSVGIVIVSSKYKCSGHDFLVGILWFYNYHCSLSVYLQLTSLAGKARQFTDQLVELVLGSGLIRCLLLVYKIGIKGTFCGPFSTTTTKYNDNYIFFKNFNF